ncbi:unnamed protein product, partial [Prorocentrum cordatum]
MKGGRVRDIWKRKGEKAITSSSRGTLVQAHTGRVHGAVPKDELDEHYPSAVAVSPSAVLSEDAGVHKSVAVHTRKRARQGYKIGDAELPDTRDPISETLADVDLLDDELFMLMHRSAHERVSVTRQLLEIIIVKFEKCGLQCNMDPGKTEVTLGLGGKGARRERRALTDPTTKILFDHSIWTLDCAPKMLMALGGCQSAASKAFAEDFAWARQAVPTLRSLPDPRQDLWPWLELVSNPFEWKRAVSALDPGFLIQCRIVSGGRLEYAIALVLEQAQFEKICDRLVEAAPAPAFTRYATTASKAGGPKDDAMTLSNLTVTALLGVSSVGPVELCRHKHTKELYALKCMNK